MLSKPYIFNISQPISSINTSLGGTAGDLSVAGFVISPSGGTLTTGFVTNGYTWNYDFSVMSANTNFLIKTYDSISNFSEESSLNILYKITPPVITFPGISKTLTINTSSSSSTNNTFRVIGGNFISDGVLPGDIILGTSGLNTSVTRKVVGVYPDYLVTDLFPNSWQLGDTAKIYNSSDRPRISTNKLSFSLKGTANPLSKKVFYTTNGSFDPIKVYSSLEERYNIDSSNRSMSITVNGISRSFNLSMGNNLRAIDIVNEINSYFDFTVAYIERINSSSPAVFFIQGNSVKIDSTTASRYFKICIGEFNFSKNIPLSGNVTSGSKCEVIVNAKSGNTLNVNIDDINLTYDLSLSENPTPSQIASSFNNQAGKCVASPGPNSLVLLAKNKINILDNLKNLGLTKGIVGEANLTDGEWLANFEVPNNDFTVGVVSVDDSSNFSDISELDVGYQIDEPSFNSELNKLIADNTTNCSTLIPSKDGSFSFSGNYDPEGDSVYVNNEKVLSVNGNWSHSASDLLDGINEFNFKTIDKFGNSSKETKVVINKKDPSKESAAIESITSLRWQPGTAKLFDNKDVQNTKNFLNKYVFKPITSILKITSDLLKLAKAFLKDNISALLNKLRNHIQKYINNILTILSDFYNGLGIYVISTLPKFSDLNKGGSFDSFLNMMGANSKNGEAFDNFVNILVRSFDDLNDPYRPILGEGVVTGGYALAIADNGGIDNFIKSYQKISSIITKEVTNSILEPPKNVRVSNENGRVVITWKGGQGLSAGKYKISRAVKSGGSIKKKLIKTSIPKKGQSKYIEENDINSDNGQVVSTYEDIGFIRVNSVDTSKFNFNVNLPASEAFEASVANFSNIGSFIKKTANSDFKFIDGMATPQEKNQKNISDLIFEGGDSLSSYIKNAINNRSAITDKSINNTIDLLNGIRDSIIYQQSSTEKSLENGISYYYKIQPCLSDGTVSGPSYEVVGTPSKPDLEIVEEDLSNQITNPIDINSPLKFYLKNSIYDNETAVIASDPANINLSVYVDGGLINPSKVIYDKGIFYLYNVNQPKESLKVSYWTKKQINSTRARIVSKNSGPFTFNKNNPSENILEIIVGQNESKLYDNVLSDNGTYKKKLPLTQGISFVRDFRGESSRTLSSEEVASIIRNQTHGIKVSVDSKNRIVLIDEQSSSQNRSKLSIVLGNDILGFKTGDSDETGSVGESPDWFRISAADLFPAVGDLIRYIEDNSQNFLKSLDGASAALTDFLDTLIKRVEALEDIIKRLQELINKIVEVLTISGGFWLLKIPSKSGGTPYLKKSLSNSTNRPTSDFAGGVLFVFGDGGGQKAFDLIFKSN